MWSARAEPPPPLTDGPTGGGGGGEEGATAIELWRESRPKYQRDSAEAVPSEAGAPGAVAAGDPAAHLSCQCQSQRCPRRQRRWLGAETSWAS